MRAFFIEKNVIFVKTITKMNPSLISFYPKFLLDEKTGSEKTPKLQVFDTSPYEDNGIALSQVSGVITLAKRENVQFYANTDFDTPDVTLDPVANVKVDLPVDTSDNTLYGDYFFGYKAQVVNEIISVDSATTAPVGATFDQLNYEGAVIADFISKVNTLVGYVTTANFFIDFLNNSGVVLGSSNVTGAENVGGDLIVSFDSVTLATYAQIVEIRFRTYYTDSVSVGYCSQDWPEGVLAVTGDCIRAQITTQDQTAYNALDELDRTITFNYPTQRDGTPVATQETTTASSLLVGPNVWTGSYAIYLESVLTRTQNDGLVLQYTVEAYNPFLLTCDAGLCCMRDCIGNIFTAYQEALKAGSPNLGILRDNVITIMGYVNLYEIALDCGNTQVASNYLTALQEYMDAIGCDCNCSGSTANQGPTPVYPLFSEPLPNYVPISYLEGDDITVNSNVKVPTNKAVINYVAALLSDYYTATQSDALFMEIQPFNSSNTVSGSESVSLNGKSGEIIYSPSSPIPAGDITIITLANTSISVANMVIATLDYDPIALGSGVELVIYSIVVANNQIKIYIKNNGSSSLDDPIKIRFIVL